MADGKIIDTPWYAGGKAEALRRSQLRLLQSPAFAHPFYWSAFLLIGNWL